VTKTVVGLLLAVACAVNARGAESFRRIRGEHSLVSFLVPANAGRSRFLGDNESGYSYKTRVNQAGLGQLTVAVGLRDDPEASIQMLLNGAEANAKTRYYRRTHVQAVEINRTRGVVGLETTTDGRKIAHCISWSKTRQFELTLEALPGGPNPLRSEVWTKLLDSFRSDEAPLKK
jgi:hypothetical protein